MPYGASFAAVYDALMAEDFDYTAWAAYYTDLLASAGGLSRRMRVRNGFAGH